MFYQIKYFSQLQVHVTVRRIKCHMLERLLGYLCIIFNSISPHTLTV